MNQAMQIGGETATRVRTAFVGAAPPAANGDDAFLPAGSSLYEYRIEKVLGHGGFGVTYLARDTHLDKPVAIKEYLPAHLAVRNGADVSVRSASDQHAFEWGLRQFLKEAQTLARFAHPNLVPVHRYFQRHGTAYIVMSYVEGETLGARLKRSPHPDEAWLRGVLQAVLEGLKAVHGAGILHRDLKPENILLTRDDVPVLIDFGAARVNLDSATRSTMCALTAGYAPLEQYGNGGHQGPWTDLYALGAVAYRAVTGRKPPEAVHRIHDDTLAPARTLGAQRYSPAFLDAIDWALALHPEARPRSGLDLQQALATGNSAGRAPALPSRASPRPQAGFSMPWATAGAPVLAVLGVVAALLGWQATRTQRAPAPDIALPPVVLAPQAPAARVPARPAPQRSARAVAQMEGLSRFQDCPDCPAMVVLPVGELAMGRHEVTVAQFQACVADGACRRPPHEGLAGDLPAVHVSWDDARAYASWLSRKTGRRYRLPTEAEWEYAARAGTRTAAFWGADRGRSCRYANAAERAGACRDGHAGLAAVGSFQPNWFDLHDTAGNVWEWTASCWDEAPGTANCTRRAVRGGSWRTPADALASTHRTPVAADHRSDTLGFRVVAS